MKLIMHLPLILIIASCQPKQQKIKTGLEGRPMPNISLLLIDSVTRVNINSIKSNRPTVLFAFEPWCPYCKAQTRSIVANIKSLEGIDFYFLTYSTYPGLKEFYNKYDLQKYSNIKAGIDYNYSFARYFKVSKVPAMAIYNKDQNLIEFLTGRNYISTIKDIIFEK